MSNNTSMRAAVFTGVKDIDNLLEVSTVPKPAITKPNQILVKAVAFASNPADWKILFYDQIQKGAIAGCDVSGIVEEVGSAVTHIKKGDSVAGLLLGNNNLKNGAYAEYVVLNSNCVFKFDGLKDDKLSVGTHPFGPITNYLGAVSTTSSLASIGVSFTTQLQIPLSKDENKDNFILVWGGASSTGFMSTQIAKKIYGLKVIAVASLKHKEMLTKAGADFIVDYHDEDVVSKIRSIAKGGIKYAIDTIANEQTFQAVYDSTYESPKVVIDRLLQVPLTALKLDDRKGTVEHTSTVGFSICDDVITLFGTEYSVSKEDLAAYLHFWNDVLPKHIDQFDHLNLQVLPSGFESANESFKLHYLSKVSGEKVVFHI